MAQVTLKDFYADWCGPCKALEPTIEELSEEHDGLSVEKIDIDGGSGEQDLANEYHVRSLPTLVIEDDEGDIVERFTGATDKTELDAAITDALGS